MATRAQTLREELDDLVAATTATVTCSHELARAMATRCEDAVDDLVSELALDQIAFELWAEHRTACGLPGLLAAFAAERERHAQALHDLEERFLALAGAAGAHVHLEGDRPEEHVRGCLVATAARIAMHSLSDAP